MSTKKGTAKTVIAGRLMDLLRQSMTLSEARLATLGGEGLEPEIWHASGIRPDHGWLIERSPKRMRKLLKAPHGYHHVQGELARFPDVFRAQLGAKAGLDLFHWDLCGTVEPVVDDLRAMAPLLFRRDHALLAITVADMRRNLSQEDPRRIRDLSARVFGRDASAALWKSLLDVHTQTICEFAETANAENVAIRELGVLTHVYRVLMSRKRLYRLEPFERYQYLSSGFRMRSYVFKIERATTGSRLPDAAQFANRIHTTPLFRVQDYQLVSVPLPAEKPVTTEQRRNGSMAKQTETTKPIAERMREATRFMSASVRRDTESLIKAAESKPTSPDPASILPMLDRIVEGIDALRHALNGTSTTKQERAKTAKKSAAPKQAGHPHASVGGASATSEHDQIRLELLAAKKQGDDAYQQQCQAVCARSGINRTAVGSIVAHACGKFRPGFAARILLTVPEGEDRNKKLTELAQLFEMPAETLKRQIHKSSVWTKSQKG